MFVLRPLLPRSILVGEGDPRQADPALLHPAEWSSIAGAVERRRREFAAGRLLARGLLGARGHDTPLPRAPDGRPCWPAGVVGSITHCATLAAAAIGSARDWAGIGIDIEIDEPLPAGVPELVMAGEELTCRHEALRRFCAKEALHKAIYPMSRRLLPFRQVVVELTPAGDRFRARFDVCFPPFARGAVVDGRCRAHGGYVAAAVAIRA